MDLIPTHKCLFIILLFILFVNATLEDRQESYDKNTYTSPYTTETSPTTTDNPNNLDTLKLVIVIVVPTLGITVICVVCAVIGYKKARIRGQKWILKHRHEIFGKSGDGEEGGEGKLDIPHAAQMNAYLDIKALAEQYKKDKWEIASKNLFVHDDDCLGNGAFASVFKGTLKGTIPLFKVYSSLKLVLEHKTSENCTVAVKKLPAHASDENKIDFFHEMAFMKRLGYHPHVISMLGCVSNPIEPLIVVEYCKHGDLLRFLRKNRAYVYTNELTDCPVDAEFCLKVKDLVSIAWQICDGLCYLSSHKFIHRDVAARNVLLTQGLAAKISDFGLCRYADSSLYTAKGGRLPIKWMAPESLKFYEYTVKTECWSYAILLFEIFSLGEAPFPSVQPLDMIDYLEKGNRMRQPMKCPNEIYSLMKKCWDFDPAMRPSFEEVRSQLTLMLNMGDEQYGYLSLESDDGTETATPTCLTYLTDECILTEEFLPPRPPQTHPITVEIPEQKKDFKKSKRRLLVDVEIDAATNKAIVDKGFFEKMRDLTANCDDIQINVLSSQPGTPSRSHAPTPPSEDDDMPMEADQTIHDSIRAAFAKLCSQDSTSSSENDGQTASTSEEGVCPYSSQMTIEESAAVAEVPDPAPVIRSGSRDSHSSQKTLQRSDNDRSSTSFNLEKTIRSSRLSLVDMDLLNNSNIRLPHASEALPGACL